MGRPLVSCVMPTRNRRRFASQAIWYFLRQHYVDRELIIVDDGEDSIADLVPRDQRIVYIRLDARVSVGKRMNIGCESARGELIADWDDEAWMSPRRLSTQIDRLLASEADICAASELLHYAIAGGDSWVYRYGDVRDPQGVGSPMVFRREAWMHNKFADVDGQAEALFVRAVERTVTVDEHVSVRLLHSDNIGERNFADRRWMSGSLEELSRLVAIDRDYFVALRRGSSAEVAPRRILGGATVTYAAPFTMYTGYGCVAENVGLGMAREGATLDLVPIHFDPAGLSAEFRELLRRSKPSSNAPVLYFCWPQPNLIDFARPAGLFIDTMWESSRLPVDWPAKLNLATTLIVPSRFVARVARESGVTVPIEVMPLGVDPDTYHFEQRDTGRPMTTLLVGPFPNRRKHVDEAIAAWKLAFRDDPEARLVLKGPRVGEIVEDDPRIGFASTVEMTRGIPHWYRRADVLLALGSEGFGLPMVEAMATGLPVVALSSEGQGDLCEEAGDLLLPVPARRWEEAGDTFFGPAGVRGVPDVVEVANRLTWVVNHRDEAAAMGRAASDWVSMHRNIWMKGRAVLDLMEERSRPPRPMRSAPLIWALGEDSVRYAALLAKQTKARTSADPPDLRSARVLHILHDAGPEHDVAVTNAAQQARERCVPVLIAERAVGNLSRAWEREAQVLIVENTVAQHRLAGRATAKRIEVIPPACPTWFPSRKSRRARAIAVVGGLERRRGTWHVLDAARQIDGAELLLFGGFADLEEEQRFASASEGLRIRRVTDDLSPFELAARLAAEADVIAFWYAETDFARASGAVRLGLASGVPVVASPTAWFADLEPVTVQSSDLVTGLRTVLEDDALSMRLVEAAREYCDAHNWERTAKRHADLWSQLEAA